MKDRETLHYFRIFFKLNIVTVAQLVESCATVFLCNQEGVSKLASGTP
mgnify:FL=1